MPVKKIAVLRTNVLGDFIFILPALAALKEAYPKAELVYLGKKWHKDFLRSRPGPIDRVVVMPRYPGVGESQNFQEDKKQVREFYRQMKNEQFDLALQFHGGGKNSNPFIKQLGAKLTVGFKSADAADLDINIPYVYYQNEILRYLQAVEILGARVIKLDPEISVLEDDLKEASQALKGKEDKPFVVVHPGANDEQRRWPAEKFSEVADALAEKGYVVCVTGTAKEKELVDKVMESMKRPAENFCGRLSLAGLTGLLYKARLYVGNDTGPLHLAKAVGTPTVGIYWCGNAITAGALTTIRHRVLISWKTSCPVCNADCTKIYPFNENMENCRHPGSFVDEVTVPEVLAQALELLGQSNSNKSPSLSFKSYFQEESAPKGFPNVLPLQPSR